MNSKDTLLKINYPILQLTLRDGPFHIHIKLITDFRISLLYYLIILFYNT